MCWHTQLAPTSHNWTKIHVFQYIKYNLNIFRHTIFIYVWVSLWHWKSKWIVCRRRKVSNYITFCNVPFFWISYRKTKYCCLIITKPLHNRAYLMLWNFDKVHYFSSIFCKKWEMILRNHYHYFLTWSMHLLLFTTASAHLSSDQNKKEYYSYHKYCVNLKQNK